MSLDDAMKAAEARREARLTEDQQTLKRWEARAAKVRADNSALTKDFLAKAATAELPKDVTCRWLPEGQSLDHAQEHHEDYSGELSGWRLTRPGHSPGGRGSETSLILLDRGWYTVQRTQFYGVGDNIIYVPLTEPVIYSEMCWYGQDGRLAVCAGQEPWPHEHPHRSGHGDGPFCMAFKDLRSDRRDLDATYRQYESQYLPPWTLVASMAHLLVEGSPMYSGALYSVGEDAHRRGP